MDHPISPTNITCRECGYNLTGAVIGGTCPECGMSTATTFSNMPRPTSGWAVASLVVGIISIPGLCLYLLPGIICGILAIAFALAAQKQYRRGTHHENTVSIALTGMICGILSLSLVALLFGMAAVAIIFG